LLARASRDFFGTQLIKLDRNLSTVQS
jgi:hypothetical protein